MMKHERLPFEVIVSASEGNPEAIATVMNFYEGILTQEEFDAEKKRILGN